MSCFTVNTQVTKNVVTPVIKVENIVNKQDNSDVKVRYDAKDDVKDDVKACDETVSNLILGFILKDLENHDGYILLSIDEMKKVLKTLCKCDDVIIDIVLPEVDVSCCSPSLHNQMLDQLEVKKILLQYNNRDCLEDFKMHYNEIKILTEDYKVDIDHVKNIVEEIVV